MASAVFAVPGQPPNVSFLFLPKFNEGEMRREDSVLRGQRLEVGRGRDGFRVTVKYRETHR